MKKNSETQELEDLPRPLWRGKKQGTPQTTGLAKDLGVRAEPSWHPGEDLEEKRGTLPGFSTKEHSWIGSIRVYLGPVDDDGSVAGLVQKL